ncbi:MAG: PTS sugar transporter subunit IIC [Gemmatimonadota bacterium]|nr:PTS sugar transporter subunit IIC [Gemmatimonadota bacterium]
MNGPGGVLALVAWGTVVGLDLTTFAQVLLSRPLVAATGAGLLLGEPMVGVQVGLVLELFALDVLPVGASRYPDYGPAAIGAVALMAGRHGETGAWLGLAIGYGLAGALLGGASLSLLRLLNTRWARRASAGLAAGDQRLVRRLQWRGIMTDLARGALLTLLLVAGAGALASLIPEALDLAPVSALAVGAGLAAAAGGAYRNAGRGPRPRWLIAGLGAGLILALAR